MKKHCIIIVDDHQLFREGIELILSQFDFIDKIIHACDGKEYLDIVSIINPDIVLMDINMPNIDGVEATRISKEKYKNIKIIAISMHTDLEYYSSMTKAGVDGFLTKDTDRLELKTALTKVLNNESFFSQKLLQKVLLGINNTKTKENPFSKRETEVLNYIINGLSTNEISDKMFISSRTVERHKENMQSKADCKNTISLIIFAIKNNIVNL